MVLGLPLLVQLEFGNVGRFVGFPLNKNSGLKFRKLHVLNGTVHSGCTDPTQATARLVIVLESRIHVQKSGTAWGQQFCQTERDISVRLTEMTRPVKVDHLQSWSRKFRPNQTEMSGILCWMENAPGCMVLCWVVVWGLDFIGKQPLLLLAITMWREKMGQNPCPENRPIVQFDTTPTQSQA